MEKSLINNEILSKYESLQAELEELKDMFWFMYEDYFGVIKTDIYTKASCYDRVRVYLYNVFKLLQYKTDEMKTFINKVYEENRKGE